MSLYESERERENKTGTIGNKMDQNDQTGATIRESRKKDQECEKDSERGNKKDEEQGKSEKVAGGRVFNICFQGNQPTIPRLRHLLS